ncbi:MAG: hypothetical protein K6T83_03780 [Alicyclobacillus sp.]|nr:hypothetical protein [Alicyclobacillus sp.]
MQKTYIVPCKSEGRSGHILVRTTSRENAKRYVRQEFPNARVGAAILASDIY